MIFTSGQKKTKRQQRRIEDAPRTVEQPVATSSPHLLFCLLFFSFFQGASLVLFALHYHLFLTPVVHSIHPSILSCTLPEATPPHASPSMLPVHHEPTQKFISMSKYKGFSLNFTHTFIILRCVTTIQNLLYFKTEEVKYKQVYFYFFLFVLK